MTTLFRKRVVMLNRLIILRVNPELSLVENRDLSEVRRAADNVISVTSQSQPLMNF